MTTRLAPILSAGRPHERLRVVTPLGIRYRDHATRREIVDGLVIMARSTARPHAPRLAVRSPSGTYGFHGLPGLQAFEYPMGPSAAPGSPPPIEEFLIATADRLGRFLPQVFRVPVPLDATGTFSPPLAVDRRILTAHLFSAPSRPPVPGLGIVRADLWNAGADRPAAHALIRLIMLGRTIFGIADEQGQVALMFPLPSYENLRLGSPPGTPQNGPAPQTWPITVQIFHDPGLTPPALPGEPLVPPWAGLPSLRAIFGLEAGAPWLIRTDEASAPAPTWSGELTFGRELVLRTTPGFRLLISEGASPP